MREFAMLTTFFLASPALAQTYTFSAPCMPDGSVTIDVTDAELTFVGSGIVTYDIPPVVTSAGTFTRMEVWNDGLDAVVFYGNDPHVDIGLVSSHDVFPTYDPPAGLYLADWRNEYALFYLTDTENCDLTAIENVGYSLIDTNVSSTPGFASVLDSGPARLASETIEAHQLELEWQANQQSCTSIVRWVGTWQRNRTPRLQGVTEDGRAIEGTSITDATVAGVPFSASLMPGARFGGATDAGGLSGHFARISSKKAIWYGVESVCD